MKIMTNKKFQASQTQAAVGGGLVVAAVWALTALTKAVKAVKAAKAAEAAEEAEEAEAEAHEAEMAAEAAANGEEPVEQVRERAAPFKTKGREKSRLRREIEAAAV